MHGESFSHGCIDHASLISSVHLFNIINIKVSVLEPEFFFVERERLFHFCAIFWRGGNDPWRPVGHRMTAARGWRWEKYQCILIFAFAYLYICIRVSVSMYLCLCISLYINRMAAMRGWWR